MKGTFSQGRVILLALFALQLQTGSLFAAEGTAQMTFHKTALTGQRTTTHIVKKGDSVIRVIRRLGMPVPPIAVLRRLNPHIRNLNLIYPGQHLILTDDGQGDESTQPVMQYTITKGDTLTRILIDRLKARPEEVAALLKTVRRLNPELTNLNKIYPGQVVRLPGEQKAAEEDGDASPPLVSEPPAQAQAADESGDAPPHAIAAPRAEEQPPIIVQAVPPSGNRLDIVRHIVKQLNGMVITSGMYYIPLADGRQVTLDCGTIPIVEMDDGTTALLDFSRRLPVEIVNMIRESWRNYRLVNVDKNDDPAIIVKNILSGSSAYSMEKGDKAIFLAEEPQLRLLPDWVVTKKTPEGNTAATLALFFAADESQFLPPPVLALARKKGIAVCEILADRIRETAPDKPAKAAPMAIRRIAGNNDDERLESLFHFLGLEAARDREIKIFDAGRDGFNLTIKAVWLVKRGAKTVLIHDRILPRQLVDDLRKQGTEPFYSAPGLAKNSLLEGVLPALGIPAQFASFSLPTADKKARFAVSFAALKIDSDQGQFYFIDFDMDQDIYEFLAGMGKLALIRY